MSTPLELLVMLILANGAPVIAATFLKSRCAQPVDGGRLWRDGRPLLGKTKTWRGLVAGLVVCSLFSVAVGPGLVFGLAFSGLALAGDLLGSFVKRRLGHASSAAAPGLDQLPEAVLPTVFAVLWLPLSWWAGAGVVVLFTLSHLLLSPLLYRLGIRRQPH